MVPLNESQKLTPADKGDSNNVFQSDPPKHNDKLLKHQHMQPLLPSSPQKARVKYWMNSDMMVQPASVSVWSIPTRKNSSIPNMAMHIAVCKTCWHHAHWQSFLEKVISTSYIISNANIHYWILGHTSDELRCISAEVSMTLYSYEWCGFISLYSFVLLCISIEKLYTLSDATHLLLLSSYIFGEIYTTWGIELQESIRWMSYFAYHSCLKDSRALLSTRSPVRVLISCPIQLRLFCMHVWSCIHG